MLCLLPLAAVALYGLGLRVGQYGWTIPRVWALYCGGLLALYALGYACALRPAGFYGTLATTNLVAAFATLVLLALVQTPVADPRRIAAQSQLQGLLDGRLEPREYRYSSMRNDHGRWGRDACASWPTAPPASAIRASRRRRRARADRQVLLLGRTQDRPDRRVAHL